MTKTILCIEDDRFIGEMYVRSLKRAGYEVDWTVDGDEGLSAARKKQKTPIWRFDRHALQFPRQPFSNRSLISAASLVRSRW